MKNLKLIPIRENERMTNEMLSFITAGTFPIQPMCLENTCKGNTGICSGKNSCDQNSGNCGTNGCISNNPGSPNPSEPNPCAGNQKN